MKEIKQSWSHKLFFRINKGIGKRTWLDKIMHVCAHELLFVLAGLVFLWAATVLYDRSPENLDLFLKLLMTVGAFGLGTSWFIGFFFPHPRPIREFPKTKQLIKPFGSWKAFPSDHTIVSFTLVFVTLMQGIPFWFGTLLFMCATAVAFGRVYAGVHYPRDIVGGICIASVYSLSSFWLLQYITQPVYSAFKLLF